MGVPISLTIPWIFFILTAVGIQNSNGIESCSEKIRQMCDCVYYPIFTVRCSHKSLSEYPDFNTIQVHFSVIFFLTIRIEWIENKL